MYSLPPRLLTWYMYGTAKTCVSGIPVIHGIVGGAGECDSVQVVFSNQSYVRMSYVRMRSLINCCTLLSWQIVFPPINSCKDSLLGIDFSNLGCQIFCYVNNAQFYNPGADFTSRNYFWTPQYADDRKKEIAAHSKLFYTKELKESTRLENH